MARGMTDEFGHWLAGMIDGEGCFSIHLNPKRVSMACRFEMKLRADDISILREIHERAGFGSIMLRSTGLGFRRDGQPNFPQAAWQVLTKADVLALMRFLERYPLRAKKRRDYDIWREAVLRWSEIHRYGGVRQNWETMGALRRLLMEGRKFDGQVDDETAMPTYPWPQLELIAQET